MSVLSHSVDPVFLAVSGFEYALQQPLLPGKLILWGLFMLSLLTWAIMISKTLFFYRMKGADAAFVKKFRSSRHPLELFERNFADDQSIRWIVYDRGARETAFQMLGSPERDETFATRLEESSGLRPDQMGVIRDAFSQGEAMAGSRLRQGIPVLNAASAGAPFLGLLGTVWILMQTFSGASEAAAGSSNVSSGVSGALAVMVVALLVATPAVFGHILIAAAGRKRLRQLAEFRSEALRLIERSYVRVVDKQVVSGETLMAAATSPAAVAPATESVEEHTDFPDHETVSADGEIDLFETLVEEPAEPDVEEPVVRPQPARRSYFETPFSEPEINPIAQQTAGLASRSEPATV